MTRLREDLQTTEPLDSLHQRYEKPISEGLALLERIGLRAEAQVLYEFANGYLVEGAGQESDAKADEGEEEIAAIEEFEEEDRRNRK